MLKSLRAILVAGGLMSVLAAAPALASRHRGHRTHESGHALFVSAARGSDTNSCTASAPCKTIGRAVGLAQPGAEIVVQHGSYAETVTVNKRLRLTAHGATI